MDKEQLLLGNKQFVSSLEERVKDKELLRILLDGQHPQALVVTCSDSRVIPEKIFSKTFGDLFVIRTAGNVINEGELASIEYGIEHLNIPLVVILAHTHCGAVHAAMHNEKGMYLDPILNRIQKNVVGITDEKLASEQNAIKEVSFIKNKFPSYKGEVIAMIYDLKDGRVSIL